MNDLLYKAAAIELVIEWAVAGFTTYWFVTNFWHDDDPLRTSRWPHCRDHHYFALIRRLPKSCEMNEAGTAKGVDRQMQGSTIPLVS